MMMTLQACTHRAQSLASRASSRFSWLSPFFVDLFARFPASFRMRFPVVTGAPPIFECEERSRGRGARPLGAAHRRARCFRALKREPTGRKWPPLFFRKPVLRK